MVERLQQLILTIFFSSSMKLFLLAARVMFIISCVLSLETTLSDLSTVNCYTPPEQLVHLLSSGTVD